jgi:chemotaxis protein histidine kinase CheA
MDELLREFLTETAESLDHVDAQLVRLEREPNNGQALTNIFSLVHTIKGTCGFLGLHADGQISGRHGRYRGSSIPHNRRH